MTTWIFGPCSAESREQVMETAGAISAVCGRTPFIFRAGVWKPRTSPRTFQGAGEQGLEWLKEVKRTYGVETATEVATPEHVAAAVNAGIDYLWIGARTSANPLAVQALADTLTAQRSGSHLEAVCTLSAKRSVLCQPKAVLIKNPVNADADLWLGNIERLEKTGMPVMAVHRGCNHLPCWKMAHIVRTLRPDIPMLLDPSHMSGDAARVPELMAKIAELNLNGSMVEVHTRPDTALSDAKQQITPRQLQECIEKILDFTRDVHKTELNWLRAEIDELDDALWDTIAARMDVSRRIGEWKKANGVTPLQPKRFEQIRSQRMEWAKQNGLDAELIAQVMEAIHKESLKQQE